MSFFKKIGNTFSKISNSLFSGVSSSGYNPNTKYTAGAFNAFSSLGYNPEAKYAGILPQPPIVPRPIGEANPLIPTSIQNGTKYYNGYTPEQEPARYHQGTQTYYPAGGKPGVYVGNGEDPNVAYGPSLPAGGGGGSYGAFQSYTPRPSPEGGGTYAFTPRPSTEGGGPYAFTSRSSSSLGGGGSNEPLQPKLNKNSSRAYLASAGLGDSGINLQGMSYDEAQQRVDEIKGAQMSQSSALNSFTFSPDAPQKAGSIGNNFKLSLDNLRNEAWTSPSSKQDAMTSLLGGTAKSIASLVDSPEALVNAVTNDAKFNDTYGRFIEAGGTEQQLVDQFEAKGTTPPNNQTTSEYVGNMQQNQILSDTSLIKNEIARQYKMNEAMQKTILGDGKTEGLIQQRINVAKENINTLERKIQNEVSNYRAQASYQIEKNNAELSVTKDTIEQNRLSAKNYMVGMLAKLGALQTTSASPIAITELDMKYQKQSQDAIQKVTQSNRDIEIKLRNAINEVESTGAERKITVRDDLSKDMKTVQKEMMKAENDMQREIYNLNLKWNKEAEKSREAYKASATDLAQSWASQFANLIGGGATNAKAAASVNVKLSPSQSAISQQARIKDPSAISYFQSLDNEFKNQWKQHVLGTPVGTFFTLADLQANYEPYLQEKRQGKVYTQTNAGTGGFQSRLEEMLN